MTSRRKRVVVRRRAASVFAASAALGAIGLTVGLLSGPASATMLGGPGAAAAQAGADAPAAILVADVSGLKARKIAARAAKAAATAERRAAKAAATAEHRAAKAAAAAEHRAAKAAAAAERRAAKAPARKPRQAARVRVRTNPRNGGDRGYNAWAARAPTSDDPNLRNRIVRSFQAGSMHTIGEADYALGYILRQRGVLHKKSLWFERREPRPSYTIAVRDIQDAFDKQVEILVAYHGLGGDLRNYSFGLSRGPALAAARRVGVDSSSWTFAPKGKQ